MKSSLASPANLEKVLASYVKVLEDPEAGWCSHSPWETVARYFILKIDVTDRWPNVVTVQSLLGGDVLEPDLGSGQDVLDWQIVPGIGEWSVGF